MAIPRLSMRDWVLYGLRERLMRTHDATEGPFNIRILAARDIHGGPWRAAASIYHRDESRPVAQIHNAGQGGTDAAARQAAIETARALARTFPEDYTYAKSQRGLLPE